ncbi:hypothetical protein DSO57_1027076 [Entomophthora muscae]|uniref:Uncharacterized protein n=2 Tax=Entomophthora muscae TaxID=34485 RepID=A0ACC2TNX9_9FUNG|nr:hypothetical protein DSO57_1027073 [Entomophthora muscae]KAJ9076364.1 hypothetical protein DSO57_1027076 [Entomophthora muscae]
MYTNLIIASLAAFVACAPYSQTKPAGNANGKGVHGLQRRCGGFGQENWGGCNGFGGCGDFGGCGGCGGCNGWF